MHRPIATHHPVAVLSLFVIPSKSCLFSLRKGAKVMVIIDWLLAFRTGVKLRRESKSIRFERGVERARLKWELAAALTVSSIISWQ